MALTVDTKCPKCGTDYEFYRGWRLTCVPCDGVPADQQRTSLDSYIAHPPKNREEELAAARALMVGRYVWLDVLPAYPYVDAEVHRIIGVNVREDPAGVDNEVFLLVDGHGHDSEIENWSGPGEPMVHTGTEAPAGRLLCRTCFPEAYQDVTPA